MSDEIVIYKPSHPLSFLPNNKLQQQVGERGLKSQTEYSLEFMKSKNPPINGKHKDEGGLEIKALHVFHKAHFNSQFWQNFSFFPTSPTE